LEFIAVCGYNGTAADFRRMRKVVDLVKFRQLEASLGFSYDGPRILRRRKEVIEYNIMLDSEFDSHLVVLIAVKN